MLDAAARRQQEQREDQTSVHERVLSRKPLLTTRQADG
jgi:hypothetical protein